MHLLLLKKYKHLQSVLINFTAELKVFLTHPKQKKYCEYGSKVKHFSAVKADTL